MNVNYSSSVTESPNYPRIQEATEQLEKVLRDSPSAAQVRVEWDRTDDERKRPIYRLRLVDPVGQAETTFSPEQLTYSLFMRASLPRVWGDLLQIHSDRQHEKVVALYKQLTNGDKGP